MLTVYVVPIVWGGQDFYPFKVTVKIIVLYILISVFLDNKQDGKRSWPERLQAFPESPLIYLESCKYFDVRQLHIRLDGFSFSVG